MTTPTRTHIDIETVRKGIAPLLRLLIISGLDLADDDPLTYQLDCARDCLVDADNLLRGALFL